MREYLAFGSDNSTSIKACITKARTNARSVRTALTIELWEAINGAWNGLNELGEPSRRDDFTNFLDFVKSTSLAVEGASSRTMLRNDAYWFSRIGVYSERADNTARILDVKYHLLLPAHEHVGGPLDYYQWSGILRSVSALTAYHWVYRESLKPWLIADLLILNDQMPRSLASCYENLVQNLDRIAGVYGRQGPAQRQARTLRTRLQNSKMDEIFQSGLHEYIQAFLDENNALGAAIAAGWARTASTPARIAATTAVVALMVASEKVSFSRVIDGQPVLRAIDRWGRPQ